MEALPENQNVRSYIIQSQEEEIKRIATELHEGVGQNLYSLYTSLQFIERAIENPEMNTYIKEMTRLMERTIQEIRMLSVELHPPSLTTLGLLPALKSYLQLYTSTYGIIVDLESCGEEKPVTESCRVSVFRVCQEALANIAKFADTSHVKITIVWEPEIMRLIIKDFGKGFKIEEVNSHGLAAMKERMHLCGGDCSISSTIGIGTSIEISLPL